MTSTERSRHRWRLLFWVSAAFVLVMALIPQPPQMPGQPSDKVQHMIAFATLALLGNLAFPRVPALRLVIGLSLFGAFIEAAQAIPGLHRDSDGLDWLADTIAAGVITLPLGWWPRGKR